MKSRHWEMARISVFIVVLAGCQHLDGAGDIAVGFSLPNVRGGEFSYPGSIHRNLLIAFLQTQPDIGSEHNPSRNVVPFLMSMDHQYRQVAALDIVIVDETVLADYPQVAGKFPSMDSLLNTSYDWALTVPLLADPKGEVARRYGVKRVPTIILVDSGGHIVERWEQIPHPGSLASGIQQLVGVPMARRPPVIADGSEPIPK
jgi:hypothetical protein